MCDRPHSDVAVRIVKTEDFVGHLADFKFYHVTNKAQPPGTESTLRDLTKTQSVRSLKWCLALFVDLDFFKHSSHKS